MHGQQHVKLSAGWRQTNAEITNKNPTTLINFQVSTKQKWKGKFTLLLHQASSHEGLIEERKEEGAPHTFYTPTLTQTTDLIHVTATLPPRENPRALY